MKARGVRKGGENEGRGVLALLSSFIRLGVSLESVEFECTTTWRNE